MKWYGERHAVVVWNLFEETSCVIMFILHHYTVVRFYGASMCVCV